VGDGAQSLNVAAPRGVFQRTRSARRPPRASVPARPSRPAQLSLEPRLAFVTAGLRCAAGQSSLPGTNDHASPRIPLRSLGRDERVRLVYLRWGRDVEPRRRSSIRLMSSSSVHRVFGYALSRRARPASTRNAPRGARPRASSEARRWPPQHRRRRSSASPRRGTATSQSRFHGSGRSRIP
jgi:hypothetical protein